MIRLGFKGWVGAFGIKQMHGARSYQIRSCTVVFRAISISDQKAVIDFPLSLSVHFCTMFLLPKL